MSTSKMESRKVSPMSAPNAGPAPQRKNSFSGDVFAGNQTVQDSIQQWKEKTDLEEAGGPAVKQGVLFGVIVPCMSNILGVLLFLRMPWIVGLAGIWQSFLAVFICCLTTFVTAISLSAVATNGRVRAGGSYFLISQSLGPAIGTGVGLLFFIANAIGAAMYIIGTVEAFEVAAPNAQILGRGEVNNIRVTGMVVLMVSAALVGAGLKYVARLASVFLSIVLVVIVAMYVGTFVGPTAGTDWNNSFNTIESDPSLVSQYQSTLLNTEWLNSVGFSPLNGQDFSDNFKADYAAEQHAFNSQVSGFFATVALWFPACTGIMAGSNRSSELSNPEKSIPFGTLTAQIVTSLIYLSFTVLYGACANREVILNDPFFAATSAWPTRHIVIYGVIVSAFGAGLQSITSATRLLTAIATDGLLSPFLDPFRSRPNREPYPSLLAASLLCAGAIAIGQINAIAPLITMCFLLCYLCVNLSTCLLSILNSPNWRPSFKYFNKYFSGFGALLCVALMLVISWWVAILAFAFAGGIMAYAARNSGDKRGVVCAQLNFISAKKALHKLSDSQLRIMILSGVTLRDDCSIDNAQADKFKSLSPYDDSLPDTHLIRLVSQLKESQAVVIFASIVNGQAPVQSLKNRKESIRAAFKENQIDDGFVYAVSAHDRVEAVRTLLQTAGLGQREVLLVFKAEQLTGLIIQFFSSSGGFQPNTLLVPWPTQWRSKPEACRRLVRFMEAVRLFSLTAVLVRPPAGAGKVNLLESKKTFNSPSEELEGGKNNVMDVWWTMNDGGMAVMLAFLLQKNKHWKGAKVRLFTMLANPGPSQEMVEEAEADLVRILEEHRSGPWFPVRLASIFSEVHVVPAPEAPTPHTVISKEEGEGASPSHLNNNTLTISRLLRPDVKTHKSHSNVSSPKVRNSATAPLRNSNGIVTSIEELMFEVDDAPGTPHEVKRAEVDYDSLRESRVQKEKERERPLKKMKSNPEQLDMPALKENAFEKFVARKHGREGFDGVTSQKTLDSEESMEEYVYDFPALMETAKALNGLMLQHSRSSRLVLTNLFDIPKGLPQEKQFLQIVDQMCDEFPLTMLVRGGASEAQISVEANLNMGK